MMDLDLLSDLLADHQAPLTGSLLSNLPSRELTNGNDTSNDSNQEGEVSNTRISTPHEPGAVISKIEDIFESIGSSILHEKKEMVIRLKTRERPKGERSGSVGSAEGALRKRASEVRTIRFPSKSPHEAWKFTALLRILELSHEALVTGVVTTKRDIYYREPELFVKQAVVDRYVDDIAYTLGVPRDALNVVAAAKGLIAGSFTITRENESVVDYGSELEGILMPNIKEIVSIQLLDVQWILVIEKEATFRTLSTNEYWRTSTAGKGIILTAKGYPDIQTRQFLHHLSVHSPSTPIYCLVDFDPDGLSIMSTYKHGSISLSHESAHLSVPYIRWLGIRSSDIALTQTQTQTQTGSDNPETRLLRLSKRDRRIAIRMLEKEIFGEREVEWRRELQVMLMLNMKAEIQILSGREGGLEGWLDGKLGGSSSR